MDNTIKTIIGKDVIESLTTGMYEDPKFVYREYIQNAADQIDKAVMSDILPEQMKGYIEIDIDPEKRQIVIEDNATGIKSEETVAILKHIAQSTKQRGVDKGFRGIGRLGGLGYCEELMFETSYQGENIKTIMIWNAKDLKNIINDRNNKEEASQVIDKVTDFDSESEDEDKHYFRVTLTGISNDDLLNVQAIREYLSMVAPVPFDAHFLFTKGIKNYAQQLQTSIDEYRIYINGEEITKAYTTVLRKGQNERDEVGDVEFFQFDKPNGEILLWGWYGISDFKWSLPPKLNPARGIRLRKGNIQIGSEDTLVKLHKEQRGNFYFIGEIYAIHQDLIPNARRDYFSENKMLEILEKELQNLFHTQLYPLYYFASNVRNTLKAITEYDNNLKAFEEKSEKGLFTDKEDKEKYKTDLDKSFQKAKKAETKLDTLKVKAQNDSSMKNVFRRIIEGSESTTAKPAPIEKSPTAKKINKDEIWTSKLSSLKRDERKIVGEVFSIIQQNLPITEDVIENLRKKIIEKYR